MRKVTFLLGLLTLLLSFTPIHAVEFWAELSGDGVWGNGADTLNINERFTIDIYFYNTDGMLLGFSTWFELRGTDSVTTLSYQNVSLDPYFFPISIFNVSHESWDGNLPDEFGIYCLNMAGIPQGPAAPMCHVELEILGDMFTEGMFCIDSASPDNITYDWLFDPYFPVSFIDTCWPVKMEPVMLGPLNMRAEVSGDGVWGEGADTLDVMKPFDINIYYDNNEYDRHYWSTPFLFTGTGNVTTLNFQDFWAAYYFYYMFDNPPGPMAYSDNWDGTLGDQICVFGNGIFPGDGIEYYALQFQFIIDGDDLTEGDFCIEKGDFVNDSYDWIFEPPVPDFTKTCWPVKSSPLICGDANDDLSVNILDVTYIVTYLYLGGPEPYNINMADVDLNCSINILDVTYLITYLYMGGSPPNCPTEWPCRKGTSEESLKLMPIKFVGE